MIVSEQAAPNLLPALDPGLKPTEAVLFVTQKMRQRAPGLELVLSEAGIRTSRREIGDEHDFGNLQNAFLDFASTRSDQCIALNVTGGTKLMALAAQSVAVTAGWRIFYVDVDTDEIIWLGGEPRRQRLTQQLRLRHYLRGYGFELPEAIERPQSSQRHHDLLRTLIVQVGSLERPLAQLNWLAQQAEERRRLDVTLTPEQLDSRSLDALLRIFQEAGVLAVEGRTLAFTNAEERDFAKGGWLETHVYRTVSDLTRELGLRDKAANLVVVDDRGVKNELDVVLLARNRLFVIECKTARMDRPEAPKANDTLFKLSEICRRVGGLGARGMLASYRQVGEAERQLAAALRIELVCGGELTQLGRRIVQWVGS